MNYDEKMQLFELLELQDRITTDTSATHTPTEFW